MQKYKLFIKILLVLSLYQLLSPSTAHAYLDPGSGSFFLQSLLAFLFGVIITVRMFWRDIKGFFTKFLPGKNKKNEPANK
jgi:hypothetical protein